MLRVCRGLMATLLGLILCLSKGSAAEPEPVPDPAPVAEPLPTDNPTPAPIAEPAAKPTDKFDFDLFDDQPAAAKPLLLVPDAKRLEFERKIKMRRKSLTLHQGFGFTTLALLAITLVLGQLNYLDKYGGGNLTGRYQLPHLSLAIASSLSFTTTGLLALVAPNPFEKKLKADRAMLHKIMMTLATAGMVTQLIMGPVSAALDGNLNQRNLALGHLVTGYATWAFMATGVLAFVF